MKAFLDYSITSVTSGNTQILFRIIMYLSEIFACFVMTFLHDGFKLTTRIMILTSVGTVATPATNSKHLYHLKISERGTTSVNLVAKKLLVSIIVNHMYIGYNRRGLVTECEGYFRILSV